LQYNFNYFITYIFTDLSELESDSRELESDKETDR